MRTNIWISPESNKRVTYFIGMEVIEALFGVVFSPVFGDYRCEALRVREIYLTLPCFTLCCYVDQGKFCIQKPADSIVLSDEFYLVSLHFAHLWGGAIGVGELCG